MSGLFDALLAPEHRSRTVCLEAGRRVSAADISSQIDRLAPHMGARRIALSCRSARLFLVALVAIWRSGGTVVLPANDRPGYLAEIAQSFDQLMDDAAIAGYLALGDADTASVPLPAPEECRLVFFTSGSTGAVKEVPKTLAQLESEVAELERHWGAGMDAAGCTYGFVSHQHLYGLVFRLLWPVIAGRPFKAEQVERWEAVAADLAPADILIATPAHLRSLHAAPAPGAGPGVVFSAGGPLEPETANEAARCLGFFPTEIYGSTETGALAWKQQDAAGTGGLLWSALPGVEVAGNAAGCLTVKAVYVAGQSWFETQDLAVMAPQIGRFELKGRADRVVKIAGRRVSISAVERRLLQNELVSDAVVFPGDGSGAARLAAVIVPSAAGAERLADLGTFRFGRLLRAELARYEEAAALPQHWRFVEEMPADSQGKRPYHLLASLFEPGEAEAAGIPVLEEIRESERCYRVRLRLDEKLLYFKGHFAEFALLPGVVQLDWAVELARTLFEMPADLSEVGPLKFRRPLVPGAEVDLVLEQDPQRPRIAFRYLVAGEEHASGVLKWDARSP
ncbi:AMP-binding protein [Radicibacter daui]|uniref:AMP-binding protein n=1 Tax=Radicibacter daui TaxID=3064829 RepID=UPI004046F8B7